MKHTRILAAILLAGTATAAMAQDFVLRDASGRRTGTIEFKAGASSGGDYIRRDASGRRIETYESDGRGGYVIRDASGRRTGTLEKR